MPSAFESPTNHFFEFTDLATKHCIAIYHRMMMNWNSEMEILLMSCSCGLALATLRDCNHFEVVSSFSEYSGRKSFSDQCIHCFEILLMLIENKIPKFKNFNILLRTKHYYLKQLRHIITKVFEQCKIQINIMTCI